MKYTFTSFKFSADSPVVPRLEKLGIEIRRTGPNEITVQLINKGLEAIQQTLCIERERVFNQLIRQVYDINEALRQIDEALKGDSEPAKLMETLETV